MIAPALEYPLGTVNRFWGNTVADGNAVRSPNQLTVAVSPDGGATDEVPEPYS